MNDWGGKVKLIPLEKYQPETSTGAGLALWSSMNSNSWPPPDGWYMISVITIRPLLLALAGGWMEKRPRMQAKSAVNSLVRGTRINIVL